MMPEKVEYEVTMNTEKAQKVIVKLKDVLRDAIKLEQSVNGAIKFFSDNLIAQQKVNPDLQDKPKKEPGGDVSD